MKIWERYFIKEVSKVFLFFLLAFFGLYALLDYSSHSGSFQHYKFSFVEILLFYLYDFVGQANVLVPLALLIAIVKTLCMLNTRNELSALLVSGIRLKQLMLPFLLFGVFLTFLLYLNAEYLQPRSHKYHKLFSTTRAKEKQRKNNHPHIQQITLEDGSTFLFQEYDPSLQQFFDAYWIRSIDDIYRIKYLQPDLMSPKGSSIERFSRNSDGALELSEHFEEAEFPELKFNKEALLDTVTSPDELAITTIRKKLPNEEQLLSEKNAKLLTTYHYKIAMPWLCLLAIIAPIPYCIRFTRSLPIFFIYALSLFGIVSVFIIMDAAVILGERQVIAPFIAIWSPLVVLYAYFGLKFAKI